MQNITHTDHARTALLQNLARAMAEDAADALEPAAGHPIDTDLRAKLAADVYQALRNNVPTLMNIRHVLSTPA